MPSVILIANEATKTQLQLKLFCTTYTEVNWVVPHVINKNIVCCHAKPPVLALFVVILNYTSLFSIWMISGETICIMEVCSSFFLFFFTHLGKLHIVCILYLCLIIHQQNYKAESNHFL